MNPTFKGYFLGAVAAASYGLNPLFALPLYGQGLGPDSVLLWRYLFAVPMMAAMIVGRGRSFRFERQLAGPILGAGVLMTLSSLFLFMSYQFMDASIASTLLFVYPLMVAVIMALFFRERITAGTAVCILAALGGIALLFKGSDGGTLSIAGTIIVMASSLSYAVYIVAVNRPGLRTVPTVNLIFYVLVIGAVLFGCKIALTPGAHLVVPQGWLGWGCIIGLALFPTVISFFCTTAAIQYIGPTPTAILGALEPATAVLVGVCVFHEQLTARDWAGLVLIIAAVSLVVAGGSITPALVRFRRLFPRLRHKR